MIYQIDDKYYVNISPNIYVEVELRLQNDDLILVPTNNQREVNKTYKIQQFYFEQEKDRLKNKLKEAKQKEQEKELANKQKSQITSDRRLRTSRRK